MNRTILAASALAFASTIALSSCARSETVQIAPSSVTLGDLGQVHALEFLAPNDSLVIAAHDGIWVMRSSDEGYEAPVQTSTTDIIDLTALEDGRQLGSSHAESDQAEALLTTADVATWTLVNAESARAPSIIETAEDTLIGYFPFDGTLRASDDDGYTWETQTELDTGSLAYDRGGILYAIGEGGLLRSADGGRTFDQERDEPNLLRVVTASSIRGLIGIGADRRVWTRANAQSVWRATGRVEGDPGPAASSDEAVLALIDDRGLVISPDAGYTWTIAIPASNK